MMCNWWFCLRRNRNEDHGGKERMITVQYKAEVLKEDVSIAKMNQRRFPLTPKELPGIRH